jgi:hypothetical protein
LRKVLPGDLYENGLAQIGPEPWDLIEREF